MRLQQAKLILQMLAQILEGINSIVEGASNIAMLVRCKPNHAPISASTDQPAGEAS